MRSAASRKKKKERKSIGALVATLAFLYLPIGVIVVYSFNSNKSPLSARFEGVTLEWYRRALGSDAMMSSLGNSLLLASLSVLIAVVIGTPAGILLSRYSFKGRSLLEKLSYLPLMLPEIVIGISFLAFYSLIGLPFGMLTMVLGHATFCIPYIMILVGSRMSGFDRSLEEAARDQGASAIRVFTDIIFPWISLTVLSAALLSFVMSLDDVVISFFTAGPRSNTLPLLIYSTLKTRPTPALNAMCTIVRAIVAVLLLLLTRVDARTGAGSAYRRPSASNGIAEGGNK
jgi:spermidine/putrescine transport system permease protein